MAERIQFVWPPLSVQPKRCAGTLHTFIVLSSEAVRSEAPSEEKLTLRTVPPWALSTVDWPFLRKGQGSDAEDTTARRRIEMPL